ncbi:hypothetical protein ACFW04_000649 [Cataglyphis niger]
MTRCADGAHNGMDKRTRSGPPHSFPLFYSACKGASPSCRRRIGDVTYFRKSSTTTHLWDPSTNILTLHINENGNFAVIENNYLFIIFQITIDFSGICVNCGKR